MSNTQAYIKAYQKLLQEKGYTESELHNGEPDGKLAASIRTAFEQCSAGKDGAEAALIRISFPGYMPEEKVKFILTLHFTYTCATDKYELDFMEADTDDFHMKIKPMISGTIPALSELHQHFKETKELRQIKLDQDQKQAGGKKRINGNRFRLN